MCRRKWVRAALSFAPLVVLLMLLGSPAQVLAASTRYVAPSGNDSGNDCLNSANPCKTITHAISVAMSGDTIQIANGTYVENPLINKNLTLKGAGLSSTIIDGGAAFRVITIASGITATISEVMIQNGKVTSGEGAGVLNNGTLTLKSVIISGNQATGGTIANDNGAGIANIGTLTLKSSYVSDNSADNDGGGIINHGTLTLKRSTVSHNTAGSYGGGVYNLNTATIKKVQFSNNSALAAGGGMLNSTVGATVTLKNVTFSGNSAPNCCGGMSNSFSSEKGIWAESDSRLSSTLKKVSLLR